MRRSASTSYPQIVLAFDNATAGDGPRGLRFLRDLDLRNCVMNCSSLINFNLCVLPFDHFGLEVFVAALHDEIAAVALKLKKKLVLTGVENTGLAISELFSSSPSEAFGSRCEIQT